jgi:hypothetical protein|tara:strand:- start:18840 stop:19484 length:645 start_codon:yes stop_codon:yes gene_type:complete
MKFLLPITFSLIFINLYSQNEGLLQYSISANALDTSLETRQKVGLMRNSSLLICFSEAFARVEFKMGGNYDIITILDKVNEKSLNLMSSPMGKFAKRASASELQTVPINIDSTSQVEVLKSELKTILGYECYKVVLKNDSYRIDYWCTDEIDIDLSEYKLTNDMIPGFPLEFSALSEGIQMKYKASNIKLELNNKETLFSFEVPVGYTVVDSGD